MNTTAPMLGSVRSGDAPGESSWDRQDYRDRNHLRSRFDRRYQDVARRGLKRRERNELAAEIAAELDTTAELIALVWAQVDAGDDALFALDADTWEAERAEADLLDEYGCQTFADLATIVAAEAAQAAGVDVTDLGIPTWGDTFDPADVQWGFSVRNRP